MQWAFLVLALLAALAELHTGTFFLAAVAAASLLTALAGFWVLDEWLVVVFVALCAVGTGGVMLFRRRQPRGPDPIDLDLGQTVSVTGLSPAGDRLIVRYRGADWEAAMDDGSAPAPGETAIIAGRTDKLLRLIKPPG